MGTVDGLLGQEAYSTDGVTLDHYPYPQMRLYALGALKRYAPVFGDAIKKVRMSIDQPRLDSYTTDTITVEELLKCVCVSSGNDAAVALAEKVAGVTELFVEQMNNRARGLGMDDTHFANPTGLTAAGHVTSAYDIALMSRELLTKHPDIRNFTTIWTDSIRNGTFDLANTNKLIRWYDGATGLKTCLLYTSPSPRDA